MSHSTAFHPNGNPAAIRAIYESDRDRNTTAEDFERGEFLIVRTDRNIAWAGRFYGESPKGLFLSDARRLMPDLVASMTISTVATEGVKVPLPSAVPVVRVTGVIEVMQPTDQARESIEAAPVFRLERAENRYYVEDPQSTFGT